ncbi:PQQ-binding-like beta-propeller repeat protein [Cellulomonas sp. ICMP 17802]|uniref:outer membrane protein assembly factor BamB family protein n=1 Tax=Cellulomonas sp. ICMP 17802 TaxID=3239199 RepID=UPI00351AF8B7
MSGRMHQVELVEAPDEPERSRSASRPAAPSSHVDVELDDDADAPDRTDADQHLLAARGWLRRHARWLVPVSAGLVLALVTTQLVVNHRESARLAALAAIPGVVPPADPSIGVVWRADPLLARAVQTGAVVDGTLVGGLQDQAGVLSLVGLDPDTGATTWTTAVDQPAPATSDGGGSLWVTCSAVPHGDSSVALCVAQQPGDGGQGNPDASVWVVDPADGSVLATRTIPGDGGFGVVDDALVVAQREATDGTPAKADASSVRWATTATDLVTGRTSWTWTSPAVDVPGREDGPQASNATGSASIQVAGDRVLVAVDGHAWILTSHGELVRHVALDPGGWVEPARSGAFLQSTWTSGGLDHGSLLLQDGRTVPIEETTAYLSVDDGSAPGVVFTVGQGPSGADGLSGWSAATGKRLWHLDGTITAGLLLDGVLYIAFDDSLRAYDATTGDQRWSTPVDRVVQQVSTDGRYLLVPGLAATLEAYSLRDGGLVWKKDLMNEVAGDRSPVYVQGFQSGWHDPRLFVWMDTGALAALG